MWNWLARLFRPRRKRLARERFMLPREWEIIRPALVKYPLKVRIYFSILFLEGARMSELRTMRWVDVDLQAQLWHKTMTKNGRRQVLALSDCSCDLLRQLPQDGPYVFSGDIAHGGHPLKPWSRTAVRYWWRRIRWKAGCPDLRVHDLRRSTASWMTMSGENLKVIQSILGHSSLEVTGRYYAHLDLAAQREALNRHAQRIFQLGGSICVMCCLLSSFCYSDV